MLLFWSINKCFNTSALCFVYDGCVCRPEQHGADMLAPLSAILQTATGEEGAPASAMALEGLYHLCEAEVCLRKVLRVFLVWYTHFSQCVRTCSRKKWRLNIVDGWKVEHCGGKLQGIPFLSDDSQCVYILYWCHEIKSMMSDARFVHQGRQSTEASHLCIKGSNR